MVVLINAELLYHTYVSHDKSPGVRGSLRDFVRRRTRLVEALAGVSLRVERAEMVAVLGPNGAGKSTLMKILVGLMRPTAGRVRVLGFEPHRKERAFLRDVGLVLGHKSQLAWDLPPSETLTLLKEVYRVPTGEFRARMTFLLDELRIGSLADTPVRKLSLGERMKFELAAALLHRPALLLLDEPTVGLDLPSQRAIRAFLHRANREFGTTVLFSSHSARDIEDLGARLVILAAGTIRYDGSRTALLRAEGGERVLRVRAAADPSSTDFVFVSVEPDVWACEIAPERVNDAVARLSGLSAVESFAVEAKPLEDVLVGIFAEGDFGDREA